MITSVAVDRPKKKVCWISAGVSSFVAGYLEKETIDEFIYIDISDQHPDSMRFIKDCEKALEKPIQILRNREYASVEDAVLAAGMIRNPYNMFYPCTNWLKKRVRKEWEEENKAYDLIYVWGMDLAEKDRANRLYDSTPNAAHQFPLIQRNMTKEEAHGLCAALGIKRPMMYDLGYPNNNCVGCLKGGMGYWNKIRQDFPDVFEKRARLERIIGASILKKYFLDELPLDAGRELKPIMEDCNLFCMVETV